MQRRPIRKLYSSDEVGAPTLGWNTRDPLVVQNKLNAISLVNFIPSNVGVQLRKGSKAWKTGFTGGVSTVMPYNGTGAAPNKLFAASGDSIYDITASGAIGVAVVSGLASDKFDWTQFAGSVGQNLIVCNGVDAARHFDGTSWITWTVVTTPSAPGQISGVDPSKLSRVIAHQQRLWFVEKNSTKAWYLPINSVGGAAQSFDFGSYFTRGGSLYALGSWSMDAGKGTQNYLIAVSDQGDAVIYEGSDVSQSDKWSRTGTWALAAPVGGANCMTQFGADMLYLCVDGLMPVSGYLQDVNTVSALTDAISSSITSAIATVGDMHGWQVLDTGPEGVLLLNVPQADSTQTVQYVYHKRTKAWCVFTGWHALCFARQGNSIFFGQNEKVMQAFQAYNDNADIAGQNGEQYTARAQQSFYYFADVNPALRAVEKRFLMVKLAIVSASASPSIRVGVSVTPGVNGEVSTNSTSLPPNGVAVWNTAIWDQAVWSGGTFNHDNWQSVSGIGTCASIIVELRSQAETTWISTAWRYEKGGV